MIEIRELRRRDYKKARRFATQGMHLDWYMDSRWILSLYSKYFWHMELDRATRACGAYADGMFAGVLLADMRGEDRMYHRVWRGAFVRAFDALQHLAAGEGVSAYEEANREMFRSFCGDHAPDGEIIFLAADPACRIKGIGTALLAAFEREEPGKLVCLCADSACTYQFYEHRGFERSEERDVMIGLGRRHVPLKCLLYSKTIP